MPRATLPALVALALLAALRGRTHDGVVDAAARDSLRWLRERFGR